MARCGMKADLLPLIFKILPMGIVLTLTRHLRINYMDQRIAK